MAKRRHKQGGSATPPGDQQPGNNKNGNKPQPSKRALKRKLKRLREQANKLTGRQGEPTDDDRQLKLNIISQKSVVAQLELERLQRLQGVTQKSSATQGVNLQGPVATDRRTMAHQQPQPYPQDHSSFGKQSPQFAHGGASVSGSSIQSNRGRASVMSNRDERASLPSQPAHRSGYALPPIVSGGVVFIYGNKENVRRQRLDSTIVQDYHDSATRVSRVASPDVREVFGFNVSCQTAIHHRTPALLNAGGFSPQEEDDFLPTTAGDLSDQFQTLFSSPGRTSFMSRAGDAYSEEPVIRPLHSYAAFGGQHNASRIATSSLGFQPDYHGNDGDAFFDDRPARVRKTTYPPPARLADVEFGC